MGYLNTRMKHLWLSNALCCVCRSVFVSFALVIRLSLSVYLHRSIHIDSVLTDALFVVAGLVSNERNFFFRLGK